MQHIFTSVLGGKNSKERNGRLLDALYSSIPEAMEELKVNWLIVVLSEKRMESDIDFYCLLAAKILSNLLAGGEAVKRAVERQRRKR
jgi:hypothetical protein